MKTKRIGALLMASIMLVSMIVPGALAHLADVGYYISTYFFATSLGNAVAGKCDATCWLSMAGSLIGIGLFVLLPASTGVGVAVAAL